MEKTCAAEKNRTTDNKCVEKRGGKKKRGKHSEPKGALWCAKKNMNKKRWVDRSRDSSLILTYHQPPRVTSGFFLKNRPKRNIGKTERKITKVKPALQSTKENSTPKVEKLSGTWSKKKKKKERGENKQTKNS